MLNNGCEWDVGICMHTCTHPFVIANSVYGLDIGSEPEDVGKSANSCTHSWLRGQIDMECMYNERKGGKNLISSKEKS